MSEEFEVQEVEYEPNADNVQIAAEAIFAALEGDQFADMPVVDIIATLDAVSLHLKRAAGVIDMLTEEVE